MPISFNPATGGVVNLALLQQQALQALFGQGLAVAPAAGTPAAPTISLQDALADIPTAQAGDPIGPEYHNTLREFCRVVTLAQGGDVSTALAVNVAPAMLPIDPSPPWTLTAGAAANGAGAVQGWLPVTLPERTVVVSLSVSGRRTGATAGTAIVNLQRAALDDPDDKVTLASVSFPVQGADGLFTTPETAAKPLVPQITDEQARAYLTVEPTRYRYLLSAATITATANALKLTNLRVTCNRF